MQRERAWIRITTLDFSFGHSSHLNLEFYIGEQFPAKYSSDQFSKVPRYFDLGDRDQILTIHVVHGEIRYIVIGGWNPCR